MIGYTDAPRAWWLVRGMARVAGVNLPRAVVDGWITREELAEMVSRCEQCGSPVRCDTWLACSGQERRMPEFCPNKGTIEALSPQ